VTWLTIGPWDKHQFLLTSLLIIDFNFFFDTRGEEFMTILLVIASEELFMLFFNFV
jgi:hypothetical protein